MSYAEICINFSRFNELQFTVLPRDREVCYDQTQVIDEDSGIVRGKTSQNGWKRTDVIINPSFPILKTCT